MAYLKDLEPELRDEVKNKNNDAAGVVIAKYPSEIPGVTLLDVRDFNDKIYYATSVTNWEVVKLNDE
jgi:hypothetical protein